MATDSKAARKARAEALQRRVETLKGGVPAPAGRPGRSDKPAPAGGAESPAEYVQRRMRDLGGAKGKKP